jgi:hypothetical protein
MAQLVSIGYRVAVDAHRHALHSRLVFARARLNRGLVSSRRIGTRLPGEASRIGEAGRSGLTLLIQGLSLPINPYRLKDWT